MNEASHSFGAYVLSYTGSANGMGLGELPIGELARRCREETLRFLRGEPREDAFCFEIFQRAVVKRDDDAWEAIVTQYRGIVLAYVGQHTAAALVREPDDYWVNRAFQRFWSAVGPDRFGSFPDLPALLKYLKLCVHSVLLDEVRSRRAGSVTSLDEVPETARADSDAERSAVGNLSGQQLWDAIAEELKNEAEEKVVHLSSSARFHRSRSTRSSSVIQGTDRSVEVVACVD